MNKRRAIYEENSVAFWPNYTTFLGCVCLFSLISIAAILAAIILIILNGENNIVPIILTLLLSIIFLYAIIKLNKLKDKKIILSSNGIDIIEKEISKSIHINWDEVTEATYELMPWFGYKFLSITYIRHVTDKSAKVLPTERLRIYLDSVEEETINKIIDCYVCNAE